MSGRSQAQLLLPLLQVIEEAGGELRAKTAADRVAERIGISAAEREAQVATTGGKKINAFDRDVRWAYQLGRLRGLTVSEGAGQWMLTEVAQDKLRNARPGVVVTVYESGSGIILWATAEAVEAKLASESINLILTSPPYPLLRRKEYGNLDERNHLEWLLERAQEWHRSLAEDGSLILNLGDAWIPGTPTQSLYQERLLVRLCDELGYHLAQRLYWENPSKLPAPAEWVTIRKVRVTPSVEQVLWLSKGTEPKASNQRVLRPYSKRMRETIGCGGTNGGKRPSGHSMKPETFARDNGGSIPHNLLNIPNTASNDAYLRACRERGLKIHPARFPEALAEFCIKLTTEPGDVVYDPFGGSFTTAAVAERLGRRFITSERSYDYAEAGLSRFGG